MAAEYKFFQPGKYEKPTDWDSDLQVKVTAFKALQKAGPEGRSDLQLFLSEVVWSAIRGDLSVARAVQFLAKTSISAREPLQRVFADVLWLVGFAAIESPGANFRELRTGFEELCSLCEKESVVPRALLARALETESVPPAVCQVLHLKKKHNQAKTKARYTITRYNLFREHSEGYAKLLFLLDQLASLEWQPEATSQQTGEAQDVLIDDVVRLAGFGHLCPNRMLSMTLDIYEKRLCEVEPCPLAQPLYAFMQRFPPKRLTEVAVFQLLAHAPAPGAAAREARPVKPLPPPSNPAQFLTVATLVAMGLVELDQLWTYLDPADAVIQQAWEDVTKKHDEELSNLSKVDLTTGQSSSDTRNLFARALQTWNQAGYQKFRLAAALISVNCWQPARRVLMHLQKLCKPALNHHVRAALCDLLKWLVGPVLKPSQKRVPQGAKPSLDSSYKCLRRFGFGLSAGAKALKDAEASDGDGVPFALKPTTEFELLIPQIREVLEHLEYFLHTDLHMLSSLWRVLLAYYKQREKSSAPNETIEGEINVIIYRHLLPAASLVPHNPFLSDLMWSVMSNLSVFQRFLIYSRWETMYDNFMLNFVLEKTKCSARQILKRVVSNAERRDLIAHQSHFHFCKLCHSNPMPALEVMLRGIEVGFNVNLIQPYVECTNRCPDMTADIMGYMLTRTCAKPLGPNRNFLNQRDATLEPWLVNVGEFVGRFFKKHPNTDLTGLLTVVAKRVNNEVLETKPSGGMPQQYKGESLVRVILENLIEFMGGLVTVTDMNDDQLKCLAGGPRLRTESIAFGKKEDASRKDKARTALLDQVVKLGLVRVLWHSLSQQRHHFLSEHVSEDFSREGGGGLKLLGLLFDGNHECFLKLTEFLTQACTAEKSACGRIERSSAERYMSLLPPFQEVFSMFEPPLAFLAIRHGLPAYGRALPPLPAADANGAVDEKAAAAAKEAQSKADAAVEAEGGIMERLEGVVKLYIPKTFEAEGLTMQFYVTFWRLSLQEVFAPADAYDKVLLTMTESLKKMELDKRGMERTRDSQHSREYKALKKDLARVEEVQKKLKEEGDSHKKNYDKAIKRLEREKSNWFVKPSPHATSSFVHEMICPRVLTSYSDALFCCHFVKLLIRLQTPGFQLLDFYNSWTIMLTQCIRCCSEREAQIFGVFLREMMSYVIYLRRDEATYAAEMKGNPCFYRNYYEDPSKQDVEYAQFGDIKKGHAKWEGRIYKAMRQGLDSEDWMEKRNALLLLSQSIEAFPVIEKYASAILKSVESISKPQEDKDDYVDLRTLATSLTMKLKNQREFWVDKTVAASDHSRRADDAKDRGGKRNALGAAGGSAPSTAGPDSSPGAVAKEGSGSKTEDRRLDRERSGPDDGHGEKRRRDGDEKEGSGLREARAEKSAKEPKDAKRDRDGAPKASSGGTRDAKDPRDRPEAKDSKRQAGTERPREKVGEERAEKDLREKRSSAPAPPAGANPRVPQPPVHDEPREKRRRTERDVEVLPPHSSRGAGAGDRGGNYSSSGASHQPRNALNSAPEPQYSGQYSGRDGGRYAPAPPRSGRYDRQEHGRRR